MISNTQIQSEDLKDRSGVAGAWQWCIPLSLSLSLSFFFRTLCLWPHIFCCLSISFSWSLISHLVFAFFLCVPISASLPLSKKSPPKKCTKHFMIPKSSQSKRFLHVGLKALLDGRVRTAVAIHGITGLQFEWVWDGIRCSSELSEWPTQQQP